MSQPCYSLSLTYFLPRTRCRLTNFVFCLHVLAVFPAQGQNTNSIMTETGLLFSSMFPGNITVPDTKQVPNKCLWDKFGFGIQSRIGMSFLWWVNPLKCYPLCKALLGASSFRNSSLLCSVRISIQWTALFIPGYHWFLDLHFFSYKEHPKAKNSSGSTHGVQLLAKRLFHVNLCAYLLQCKRGASGSFSTFGEVRSHGGDNVT